jgi:hypothetical protein
MFAKSEREFLKVLLAIHNILGIPQTSGGKSTSDTGQAVMLREGWISTGNRIKKNEKMFAKSEREFLKVLLAILRIKGGTSLELSDIEIRFTPMLTGNLYQKAQLADTLYKVGYDIKDVTETAELFLDIEGAIQRFNKRKESEHTPLPEETIKVIGAQNGIREETLQTDPAIYTGGREDTG